MLPPYGAAFLYFPGVELAGVKPRRRHAGQQLVHVQKDLLDVVGLLPGQPAGAVRRFLLELASFETFDLEMARMVSGNPHAGEMLDWLQRNTTMLRYDGIQQFRFWPQFRRFLLWEMEREYSEEKRRAMFNRGGMYYELKEDYPRALACYTKGGDHTKVPDLLIRNAELHPGMGHYQEMEKYYRALSEEKILAHPSLMQGMSMLCALSMDYEGSERWYDELRKYAERCGRQDAAGKRARSRPKAEIFMKARAKEDT